MTPNEIWDNEIAPRLAGMSPIAQVLFVRDALRKCETSCLAHAKGFDVVCSEECRAALRAQNEGWRATDAKVAMQGQDAG